jgi:hypothetical protein
MAAQTDFKTWNERRRFQGKGRLCQPPGYAVSVCPAASWRWGQAIVALPVTAEINSLSAAL